MSGRPAPASDEIDDCTSKSTRSISPAASTTLRSWVSPHTPRVELLRSALASDSAVERSRSSLSVALLSCSLSWPCCRLRCVSRSVTFCCIVRRVSCTGVSACSTLLSARSRSFCASCSRRLRSLNSRYCSCCATIWSRRPAAVAWMDASSAPRVARSDASSARASASAAACRASSTAGSSLVSVSARRARPT